MTMLKRAPTPPRRQGSGRAFEPMLLTGGQVQPLSAVRSSYGQQLLTKLGNKYADWDNYALAEAYETGLTAYACITTRATILAQIPLRVETAQGDILPESPASDFIARSREMLWWMTGCHLIFGQIYLKKCLNRFGFPSLLDPINPIDVFAMINHSKKVIEGYRIAQTPGTIPRYDMVDIRNPSYTNDFGATSPLGIAIRRVAAQESLAQWIASFFANSARIDGILSYEGEGLDEEEVPKIEAKWKALFKGPVNAFKTFIAATTGMGKWVWTPIQNRADELAMPETTKILREDICAALGCHPILIGLAGASDALSANSTYKAVHDEHVQYVALPTLEYFCEQLNNQWLAVDFPLFGKLKIVPDLTEIQGDLLATSERATTASTNIASTAWGVNDARKFIGFQPIEGHIERNPDWALRLYEAGGMPRNEMRTAVGLPVLKDVPDGFIYEIDPRAKTAPGDIFGGMFGGGNPQPTPPNPFTPDPNRDVLPDVSPPPALPAIAGNPASVTLSLANNGDLINLQNRLRQQFPDAAVRWLDPAEFHITLVSCPVMDDATLMALYDYVSSLTIPPLALRVGSLASFDSVGEHAIHFRIRRNQDLIDLQAKIAKWLTANEVDFSSYHLPDLFQPHITMCYAPDRVRVIKFEGGLTVSPRQMCFSRRKGLEDYEDVYTIELSVAQRAHPHEKQLAELDKWRDKVKRSGDVGVRFVTETLSNRAIEFVVDNLADGWNPSEVFTRAKEWLRQGEEEGPPDLGAPPEEWAEYWSGFDDIPDTMAEEWLGYQAEISKGILSRALSDEPSAFDLPDLQADREKLVAAWVGTEDAPGPLLQFILAGMAAGDRSLKRTTRAEVSWEIVLADALDFTRAYAFDLIRNIDQTTRDGIRDVMEKSVQEGWSKAQLEAELSKVLVIGGETPSAQIQRRADLIARTEGIRAFNEGAFKRWEVAGVTRAKWQTVNDGNVCPICRALHGTVAEFRAGWAIQGKVYKAIAHPGCRCFRRPVV